MRSIWVMRSCMSHAISYHENGRSLSDFLSSVRKISQKFGVFDVNSSGVFCSVVISGSGNGQYSSGRSGNFLCGSSSIFIIGDSSIISSGVIGRYFQSQYRSCISSGSLNHKFISSWVHSFCGTAVLITVSAHWLYRDIAHRFHISLRIRDTCFFFSKNGVMNSSITHRIYLSGWLTSVHCAW